MTYRDPEVRRARDRERFRRRTAERIALGLCPRCGASPPAPDRTVCGPCAGKRNAASRVRDARLRAAGKPRRDPVRAREYERERSRKETAARHAEGICTHVAARRRRHPAARPASHAWSSAVPPTAPNTPPARPPVCSTEGRTSRPSGGAAEPRANGARRRASRRGYASGAANSSRPRAAPPARRAGTGARRRSGCNTGNGDPPGSAPGAAGLPSTACPRCGPCTVIDGAGRYPERRNARSRQLYAERRARGLCTSCGAPSQGAARCAPCAEKSYHGSAYFKGIPVWDPTWTVIDLETGEELGTFDSEADVALCLALPRSSTATRWRCSATPPR